MVPGFDFAILLSLVQCYAPHYVFFGVVCKAALKAAQSNNESLEQQLQAGYSRFQGWGAEGVFEHDDENNSNDNHSSKDIATKLLQEI